ncbi:MAG: DUF523 domain-containing protein [Oscillospiraceae bacterium]|nr:DUF523 domain-containing protein [Oscillospiraceae bacterium]
MRYILVSACLLGVNCKYSGGNNQCADVLALLKQEDICLIPVCPEQLGGLTTPRAPSERRGNQVVSREGEDVTAYFVRGAEETLKIAEQYHCDLAILKERSPSCGTLQVYDGTFSGILVDGMGVTAALLIEKGIRVINEFGIKL